MAAAATCLILTRQSYCSPINSGFGTRCSSFWRVLPQARRKQLLDLPSAVLRPCAPASATPVRRSDARYDSSAPTHATLNSFNSSVPGPAVAKFARPPPRPGQADPLQCLVVPASACSRSQLAGRASPVARSCTDIRLERYPFAKFGLCLFVVLQVLVCHPRLKCKEWKLRVRGFHFFESVRAFSVIVWLSSAFPISK